jgi:hypothetical protein
MGPQGPQGLQGDTGVGERGFQGVCGVQGSKTASVQTSMGYRELSCMEAPEVLFVDIIKVVHDGFVSVFDIDPLFVEVCEPGSLKITSAVCEEPIICGSGMYTTSKFYIKTKEKVSGYFTVMVSGVRKGFGGRRFAKRTKEDFEKNQAFWSSI